MSINSVGSSFTHVPLVSAARETAASARAAEAADASVTAASSGAGANDWPPRLASERAQERRLSTVYGRLVAAQEEAASKPKISSHDAARAYSGGR